MCICVVCVHLFSLFNIGAVFPFAVHVEDVFTFCTMTHMQQCFFFLSVTSWVEMFCCCNLFHVPELCSAVYFLFSWGTFCYSLIGCWSHADCDSWSLQRKSPLYLSRKLPDHYWSPSSLQSTWGLWQYLQNYLLQKTEGPLGILKIGAGIWHLELQLSVLVQTSFFVSSLSCLLFHQ